MDNLFADEWFCTRFNLPCYYIIFDTSLERLGVGMGVGLWYIYTMDLTEPELMEWVRFLLSKVTNHDIIVWGTTYLYDVD
jgi:hypothetical protein